MSRLADYRVDGGVAGEEQRHHLVADLGPLLRARRGAVLGALADRYQADLLYYGLVLKYWPALSPEAFRLAAPAQQPDAA